MNKLLFFGSLTCDQCNLLKQELELSGIKRKFDYTFIDALADETQDFCDEHEVEELPHIKIYDENGNLIFNKIKDSINTKEIMDNK